MSEFGPKQDVPMRIPPFFHDRRARLSHLYFIGDYSLQSTLTTNRYRSRSVYRAESPNGMQVAIKVDYTDPTDILKHEGPAHAKVSGAPHIVPLIEYGSGQSDQGQCAYLVTPYREGGSLSDYVRFGPLPLNEVVDLTGDIAMGVQAIQRNGLLYTDLKPHNSMLTWSDQRRAAELIDFGGALPYTPGEPLKHKVPHTPPYVAPELYRDGDVTPAFVTYGLALNTAQMLLGYQLIKRSDEYTHRILHSAEEYDAYNASKINRLRRRGRGAFVEPIRQALHWEPEQRPEPLAFADDIAGRYQDLLTEGPDRGRVFFTAARAIRRSMRRK